MNSVCDFHFATFGRVLASALPLHIVLGWARASPGDVWASRTAPYTHGEQRSRSVQPCRRRYDARAGRMYRRHVVRFHSLTSFPLSFVFDQLLIEFKKAM